MITIQFDCFETGNILVFGEAFLGVSSLTSWFGRRFASRRFRARLLNLVRCPKAPSWNNSLSAFKLFRKLFEKLRQRFFVFSRHCSTRLKTLLHHVSQLATFRFWEKANATLFISSSHTVQWFPYRETRSIEQRTRYTYTLQRFKPNRHTVASRRHPVPPFQLSKGQAWEDEIQVPRLTRFSKTEQDIVAAAAAVYYYYRAVQQPRGYFGATPVSRNAPCKGNWPALHDSGMRVFRKNNRLFRRDNSDDTMYFLSVRTNVLFFLTFYFRSTTPTVWKSIWQTGIESRTYRLYLL